MRGEPARVLLVLALFFATGCARDARNSLPDDPFSGSWEPVGSDGLVRIEISQAGGQPSIQAWGACHPEPCRWASVPLTLFTDAVTSTRPRSALATWQTHFSVKTATLHLDRDELVVDLFTVFTDGSKRSNFSTTGRYRRTSEAMRAVGE